MERQRLIKLIENKGTSSKEETSELWDIVRTFPYFQTTRLLLAKSFHNQGSIHFHSELKTASAYAADRKVLFHLINDETTKQTADEESNVFVIEQKQPLSQESSFKSSEVLSDKQFALSSESEESIETPAFEIKENTSSFRENTTAVEPESKYREEPEIQQEKIIEEKKSVAEPLTPAFDEPATTNEEIIRRRLSEILAKNKPAEQEIISEAIPPTIEKAISSKEEVKEEKVATAELPVVKEEESTTHSVLDKLPAEPMDEIEGLEIETIIEENYLQELEKLPEISPAAPQRGEADLNKASEPVPPLGGGGAISFIDWLKRKSGGHTTVEEVKDEPLSSDYNRKDEIISPPSGDRGALIDKFIAAAPRIAPPKTEFYSPANMARQSIIDNEDIISETLARIYFDQGNYPKARSCYERLTLLYPEKSASFAPFIEKINNILKENHPE